MKNNWTRIRFALLDSSLPKGDSISASTLLEKKVDKWIPNRHKVKKNCGLLIATIVAVL